MSCDNLILNPILKLVYLNSRNILNPTITVSRHMKVFHDEINNRKDLLLGEWTNCVVRLQVITDDGYILNVFRIPGIKKSDI